MQAELAPATVLSLEEVRAPAPLPLRIAGTPILLVDDYPSMLRVMRRMLLEMGFFSVYQAMDGQEALVLIERGHIGLVISDLKMGSMDGLELLRRVRTRLASAKLPFVIASGNCDRVNVRDALAAGVTDVIVKPFTAAILRAKLCKVFGPF